MFQVEQYDTKNTQSWLIRQFEFFQFDDSFIAEKFIPRPDISIIFHFKDTPLILDDTKIRLEPFFAAPIISKSLVLNFHGTMDSFVVICKPTVFSRIFAIDLSPLKKRSINLPDSLFYPLWLELSETRDASERIGLFTSFINSFHKSPYSPDAVDLLYDKIIERGSTTLLKDIIADCPGSQRTLERNFIKRTGVSPKTLMRIVRIDYLWTKIKNENAIDYQELVFKGNYFDQAHFINDFKSIIGEAPSYFFNRNLNIVKMFSGRVESKM